MTAATLAAIAVAATTVAVVGADPVAGERRSSDALPDSSAALHDSSAALFRVSDAESIDRPSGPLFLIFAGTDDRPGLSGARNDGLHLIGIDPDSRRGTVLNIPRDTYASIPGYGRQKITAAHQLGGPQLLADTVAALTGVRARYVLTTNFAGFVNLVDAVGGVRVEIPTPVRDRASGADFPAGRHLLSGDAALAYARARKTLPGGDITRTHNQGRLLLAALAQVREDAPGYRGTVELLGILLDHVKTYDLGMRDLFVLARLALSIDPDRIANVTMPATTGSAGGASVVFPTAAAPGVFADLADDGVVSGG